MVERDWWRTFFSGVANDLWFRAVSDEQTRAEADFLERVLRLAPGARVLDVPCGGGRHAVELAARGHAVTGADFSEECIDAARTRARQEGVEVAWEGREMRDLPWRAEFDALFCFGNSFGYLDDPGNAAFLEAAARTLRPGGRLAIETGAVAEVFLTHYQERRWYEVGDILFLVRNSYDHDRGGFETEYTFVRGGEVERRQGWQRAYAYSELRRLLEAAGFEAIEGFSSLAAEPFRLGAQRLYLTATRRA